jgi:hypothetical protein
MCSRESVSPGDCCAVVGPRSKELLVFVSLASMAPIAYVDAFNHEKEPTRRHAL